MLARIAGLTVAALGTTYVFYDLHSPVEVDEMDVGQKIYVYKQFQGNYWNMNDSLQKLRSDFVSIKNKDVTLTAFYLDNPRMLVNMNKGRGVLGGFFDASQKAQVEQFLKEHPEYKAKDMQPFKTLHSSFTYRSYLSFRASRYKKVRSNVYKYGFKNEKFSDKKQLAGLLEMYPYLNGQSSKVDVMVPYDNIDQFRELNLMAQPQTKAGYQYAGVLGDYNYIFFR